MSRSTSAASWPISWALRSRALQAAMRGSKLRCRIWAESVSSCCDSATRARKAELFLDVGRPHVEHQGGLGRPPPVDRLFADARARGDALDRHSVVADLNHQ